MQVSIVTVSYNAATTIADTLTSVAKQSYSAIEHIVIDGASTDNSVEVITQNGKHIARFVTEPDAGIYDAMNKGFALSSGDIVGFLNADDFYAHDQVIEEIVECMQRDKLDAVYGDVVFFHSEDPQKIVRRYRSSYFRPSTIAWGWMPAHPALFLHRRVFEQYGSFRTDYNIAADFEFIARVFHSNSLKYLYLPEVLVKMRTGGVSTGGWRNSLLLNREVLRACRENNIYSNALMVFSKYPIKFLEFLWR